MPGKQGCSPQPEDHELRECEPFKEWDQELEGARSNYERAVKDEEKAREGLIQERARCTRLQQLCDHARKMEQQARTKEATARRMAGQARRQADAARLRGQPYFRWQTDARRWEAEARQALQGEPRWKTESRRNDLNSRSLDREVRALITEVKERAMVTHRWKQRLEFLTQRKGSVGHLASE